MLKSSAEYNFDNIAEDEKINDILSDQWQKYHQKQKNLLCEKINNVIISDKLKNQLKSESTMGDARQRSKSKSKSKQRR